MIIIKSNFTCLILLFLGVLVKAQSSLDSGDHYAPISGIKIHYIVAGKGPVCLLPSPGWGVSIKYLRKTLYPFEKYFTMVYYDTRLSGQSTGPSDSTKYSSNEFMLDMDSLRIFLKQPKVWVMGHSAGGFQVLNYGIHHNNRLNGIIVIDGLAAVDSLYEESVVEGIQKRRGQPYYEKASKVALGTDTTNRSPAEAMWIILPFYLHDQHNMAKALNSGISDVNIKTMTYAHISKFYTENLLPDLHNITVPTLVIVGDDDFVCPESQSDRIANNIKSSTEVVIKDAGHMSWIEQPDQFFMASFNWLKKQNIKEN